MRDQIKKQRRTTLLAAGVPLVLAGSAVSVTDVPTESSVAVESSTATAPDTVEESGPTVTEPATPTGSEPPPTTVPSPATATVTDAPSGPNESAPGDPDTEAGDPTESSGTLDTAEDPGGSPSSSAADDATTVSPTTVAEPPPTTTTVSPEPVAFGGVVRSASGSALAGVWVQLVGADQLPVSAVTADDGSFLLEVPVGPASLRIESLGGPGRGVTFAVGPVAWDVTGPVSETFVVPDPIDVTVAVVAPGGTAPQEGALVGVANQEPVRSTSFELVPGLVVDAVSYPWTAATDAGGLAVLSLLPTAEAVSFYAAVPGPDGYPNVATAQVPELLVARTITLTLAEPVPPIRYTGLVRSADGRPIPDVWVHVTTVLGARTATSTGADGRFALDLPVGPATLSLISAGSPALPYSFSISGVELDLAADLDHELMIPDPVVLSVAVHDRDGNPLEGAYAGLDDFVAPTSIPFELLPGLTATAFTFPWAAPTGADGVASLRLLPTAGPLRIYGSWVDPNGFPSSAAVEGVDARDAASVRIDLS